MSAAAANVAAFINAATGHERGQLHTIAVEYDHRRTARFPLTVADLQGLLDRLDEVCPDHERCEFCNDVVCESCGLGEPATCSSMPAFVHCADPECIDGCKACATEVALDRRAEAYADARGWKY